MKKKKIIQRCLVFMGLMYYTFGSRIKVNQHISNKGAKNSVTIAEFMHFSGSLPIFFPKSKETPSVYFHLKSQVDYLEFYVSKHQDNFDYCSLGTQHALANVALIEHGENNYSYRGKVTVDALVEGQVDFTICFPQTHHLKKNTKPFSIIGHVDFLNPHGYISANRIGYVWFNLYSIIFYVGVSFFWGWTLLQNYDYQTEAHIVLTRILIITIISLMCKFSMLYEENMYGEIFIATFYIHSFINAALHGFIRYITLAMSFGFFSSGPVVKTSSLEKRKAQLFGYVYGFVCLFDHSLANEFGLLQRIIMVLISLLDAYWSVQLLRGFNKLYKIALENGKIKRAKLFKLSIEIVISIIILAVLSGAVHLVYLIFYSMDYAELSWFFTRGIFSCEYTAILVFCLYKYRPSEFQNRYNYESELMQELDSSDLEKELQMLMSNRNIGGESSDYCSGFLIDASDSISDEDIEMENLLTCDSPLS